MNYESVHNHSEQIKTSVDTVGWNFLIINTPLETFGRIQLTFACQPKSCCKSTPINLIGSLISLEFPYFIFNSCVLFRFEESELEVAPSNQ